jgi:Bacterial Ig-like domain (group 3)/FG-GAP-like repeat
MLLRSGRILLTAVFALSLTTGASWAQRLPNPETTHSKPAATPFDRYMRPVIEKLSAKTRSNISHQSTVQPTANTDSTPSPNFGGYLSGTSYPARAANSAQYDPVDNGVDAVLSADFDKDGLPDLAVIQNDGTLNILRNTGGGVLSAPIGYLNNSPNVSSISLGQAFTADLNADGFTDIVAFDPNNFLVLAWINNGDGTFKQPVTTQLDQTLGYPTGVTVADVNGDAKADVVVAYSTFLSRTSGTITVQTLESNGDASFTALTAQNYQIPTYVSLSNFNPIAVGDMNGDGRVDIAILNTNRTSQSTALFAVYVAVGNGDGTFGALNTTPVISDSISSLNTSGVQILDLNNDGKLDIATDINNSLYVALGNGDGTFSAQVSSPFETSSATVFADMNGDGIPDAITEANAIAAIFLGKGDGTFTAPPLDTQYVTDLTDSTDIAISDLTGDGKPDIAVLSTSFFEVEVITGNGDGSLKGAPALTVPGDIMPIDNVLLGVVDANGDAYTDIFLANYFNNSLTLYTGLSDGKGGFTYVTSLPSSALPGDYAGLESFQADVNGDGKQDIFLTGYAGEIWVALAKGDGTFATPAAINMPTLACPVSNGAAGDLNGDGKTDLVIAYPGDSPCGGSTYASGYFVIPGNGDGTFQTPVFYPAGVQLYSATLADMNLDGNLDLFLNDLPPEGTGTYQITLQLGNGDGTFGASSPVLSNYVVLDFKVADINQDGKPDLVLAADELDGGDFSTGGIFLISGNGDGTFGARGQIASGNFFEGIEVADVNGDGIPDIEATQTTTSGQANTYFGFVTLIGTGENGFSAPYNELVDVGSNVVLTGNFFDDNALDAVINTPGGIGLFLNQGGTTLTLTASSASINMGDSETLTATVAATMTGRPAPTGSVSFYDGATLLATSQVKGGSATFSANGLAVGAHSITATYTGDANFNLNTSAAATVTVSTLAPAFTLSGSPSTLTLKQGANGTVILTLAANAAFSGPVTLSCSGAPTNGTCSFDATTVNLTAGGAATATLIVGTTGTVSAAHIPASPWERTGGMVAMAGLAAFFWSRRRRLHYLSALGMALLAITVFGVSGCGGSSSKTTTPTTPTAPVVSTGSYTITVTATATGAAASQTSTVSVTVD